VGRAETVGRPLLYGTTQKFMKVFSLKNLDDLPKLREIEEIIKEIRSKGAEESIQLEITALGDSSTPEPPAPESEQQTTSEMAQSDRRTGQGLVRLNKHLSSSGVASRRKADEMIAAGRIKVNGRVVTELGTKIKPGSDKVEVDGKGVRREARLVYILLNKPKDAVTTSRDEKGRRSVLDIVKVRERVYPVGRLDRNTTGVLLLTNDGELANRLMHPRHLVLKVYKATLDRPIRERELGRVKKGVQIDATVTVPDDVYILPESGGIEVGIAVHEGKHHLVKRIFESVDIRVVQLDRYSYAGLNHHGLQRGEWRHLTRSEISTLRKLVELPGS